MEVAGAAGGEAAKSAIGHIEREVGYLVHLRRNTNDLKNKVEQLKAQITDVERLIQVAENNNEDVRENVRTWLVRARDECSQATEITSKAERITNCFAGWCCLRFSLGRKAEKKVPVIQALLEDRRNEFANVVSDPKPTQSLELLSTPDFEAFASRGDSCDQIIQSLKDDKTQLIGVWGMPGVGKTMLAKEIAKKVKRESLFKEVVTVTVSQKPDWKTIQGAIAKDLELKFKDDDTFDLRARKLSERLKKPKKVLIVLDDIWERVELNEVGIPCKDESSGCKVLFTTRSDNVCNAMETQERIQVKVLSEPDSRRLFRLRAGDLVDSLEFQQVATDIISKCGGLPLAIVTLGRALRNKKKNIWDSTLLQLQKSIFDGKSPVVSSIRLSYNFLPDKTKLCFLFWSLFPEDYVMRPEELFSYLIGEKLLRDVETLEEARAELHLMVESLVSMCLLQRDEREDLMMHERGGLMMHDVVRDVAVSFASEEGQGFVLKVISPLSQGSDIGLDNCKRLSLILKPDHFDSSEIQPRLPCQIPSPQLVTLSLSGSDIKEIPPDFFRETKNILTLHLSDTDITSLPPSLSFLVNLRTLRLERCRYLRSLSPIEKLEKLEILVLNNSHRLEFPKEIRGLSNLRLLDLSFSDWHKGLSPEVISSLSRLEQLYMTRIPWRGRDGGGDGYDSILSEIGSLNRLTHLELELKLNESLSERLSTDWGRLSPEMIHRWKNLKKFQLSINMYHFQLVTPLGNITGDRCLTLGRVSFPIVNNFVKVMMCRATGLSLRGCRGLENVVQEVDQSVKLFGMEGCQEMQYLITNLQVLDFSFMPDLVAICDGNGNAPLQGFFNKLRVLTMIDCPRLIKLTSSPTFSNIRIISIEHCPSVKNLFPIKVVRHLLHLEEIYIIRCRGLEIIIADDSSDQGSGINADKDKAILPRLTRLTVIECGQLHSFCPPGLLVHWPSLNELKVTACPNLKRLPFGTDSVPKIASLGVDREWFNEVEWNDESIKSHLQLLIVDGGVRDYSDDSDDSD